MTVCTGYRFVCEMTFARLQKLKSSRQTEKSRHKQNMISKLKRKCLLIKYV